jgi:ArsR family transcriptional regulator, arsenate/arsenite/antimonite-responsive transcriptional repressor
MAKTTRTFDREQFFSALADHTRLRLLNLMADGEICVCFFTETLGESQPKISRHLAYMRRAGIVEARRDGKWMHYRIAQPDDEHAARVLRSVIDWLRQDHEMQRDREQIARICCAPQLPVQLQGAPIPRSLRAE